MAASMDGVVDVNFAIAMGKLGGIAVLNLDGIQTRYDQPGEILKQIASATPEEATKLVQSLYENTKFPVKEKLIAKRIEEINQQIDNLIKLHSQEAISTNIFTNRTKKLETELDDLQDLLKAKTSMDVDVPDLLNYVADVLKNPHLFWERSTIEIKRKLQVFDFPNGIIFDGINLRTPKVCRLFKLKELIDGGKFPGVDLRISEKQLKRSSLRKTRTTF